MLKLILLIIAFISFVIGTVGIFLPLIPTVPLYLLSLLCLFYSEKKYYYKVKNLKFIQKFLDYKNGLYLYQKIFTILIITLLFCLIIYFSKLTFLIYIYVPIILFHVWLLFFKVPTLKKNE